MNMIIDHLLFIPIFLYVVHYIFSFYSHYYKTNRNTMHMDELISNKIYRDRVLKR